MKKAISLLLILVFCVLLLQLVVNFFVNEKNREYTLKVDKNTYKITEHLKIVDNISYYNIEVTDKDGFVYNIFLDEDFNKQTEIIRDIRTFKKDNIRCIFPIFRRDITSNIVCLYNGETVSYSYLKQIGNSEIKQFVSKLEKDSYNHESWDDIEYRKDKLYSDGKGIDVYKDNILEDYVFLIWRYKGLYILRNNDSIIKDYLDSDIYDNSLSALVDRYYVTAERSNESLRIKNFYYYDIDKLNKGTINLPSMTSSNFYLNGVYKNKLYLTDVGNKKQFTIDPANEKAEEVGNSEIGFFTIENGKKKEVSATEFLSKHFYFNGLVSNEKISTKYGDNLQIKKDEDFYYFKTSNGKVYRSHIDNPKYAELLFQFENITEWKVKNGDIMLVVGEMVYFYNEKEGLVPIAYNKELTYNYNNIIDFWKE